MAIVGGDLKEIRYNGANASGTLYPKAGCDSTVDNGGYKIADDAGNRDGAGNLIITAEGKNWMVECPTLAWDMGNTNRMELEQLQAISNNFQEVDWIFTWVNGISYSGTGIVVGEVQGSGKDSTISFKAMGSGILSKLS